MCADGSFTGPAGLLRVAALPVTVLAKAGNPALFERIRGRGRSEVDYAGFAGRLAARLTAELVPHPELPAAIRGLALATRRTLLRGQPVDAVDCRRLAVVNAVLDGQDSLTGDLLRAAAWSRDLVAEDGRLARAIERERERLATLPWELATSDPAVLRVVADAAPNLPAEIRERLADDPAWSGKRMRQRADYLLRILARAAYKTTPRGWLGHVAVVGSGPGSDGALLTDATVGDYAVHTVGNIGAHRRELSQADDLPDASLSMAGLHWIEDDRLCCWVADPDTEAGVRLVRVRRTQPLDVVSQALGGGAVRAEEIAALLAPDGRGADVVRGFLHHLVRLGIVQASTRPRARLRSWSARPRPEQADGVFAGGFVDVYRRASGHVPGAAIERLGGLVDQARRVQAAVGAATRRHPVLDTVDSRPRPVTELVARFLDGRSSEHTEHHHSTWSEPEPGTAHHRLCEWIAGHADHDQVDLTPAVLDDLGVPPVEHRPWPTDCLVRPLPSGGPFAVLEGVNAAGVIDARFVDALRGLHEDVSHVDAYRAFLDAVAGRCGVEIVEVLVPPNGLRCANAVRRPRYTGLWTGDADPATYLGDHGPSGRYLPLGHITVRRDGARLVAEDPSGRPVWPICHATRVPPRPWDAVLALLMATSPVGRLAASFAPGDPMTAFPARRRLPRLVVDGGLVLAPRSVVVSREDLPRPAAPLVDRVRALARLRAETGAPRWNFLRARGARRPRPVDLDSVAALRVFDRVLADPSASALVLEEMLPGPDDAVVRSEAGEPLAAQLLVRLPHRASPDRLADEVARAWSDLERSTVDGAPLVAR
ncbi:lantibiotic dehydratase family protein [Actinophytocola oryzae]|uniref:Lantibiotic biosynthesis dehydratase-like protein n=1 Tax=Actinophytocola oryzae TaxID=502181 RepID=A0A4R7VQ83_9PSEU|nr:lantibiotic dehydratase family protein [Actinophytocola oryzae]TDV51903.1 hypothetical protein CLV71_10532 [Actinophytocola oryzae]